jgi:hypothetical protein
MEDASGVGPTIGDRPGKGIESESAGGLHRDLPKTDRQIGTMPTIAIEIDRLAVADQVEGGQI